MVSTFLSRYNEIKTDQKLGSFPTCIYFQCERLYEVYIDCVFLILIDGNIPSALTDGAEIFSTLEEAKWNEEFSFFSPRNTNNLLIRAIEPSSAFNTDKIVFVLCLPLWARGANLPIQSSQTSFPIGYGLWEQSFFLTDLTSLCGLWLHVQTLVKMSFLISRPSEIRISFSIVFQSPWRARESRPKKKKIAASSMSTWIVAGHYRRTVVIFVSYSSYLLRNNKKQF